MSLDNISIANSGIVALLGYAVVLFGLILLMAVIMIIGKCFAAAQKKEQTTQSEPAPQQAPEAPKPTAPGSAGEVKLYNVEPKTAAMLMAIVADKLGKPLNELRFISIKEVE